MMKPVSHNAATTSPDWEKSVTLSFDQETPPPKTRGEKIFNALSWGFCGWILNAVISIKLADTYQNRLRNLYVKGGEWLSSKPAFNKLFKGDVKEAEGLARSLTSVLALLPGGYAIIAPIKWMEDRKLSIVSTLDNTFGSGLDKPHEEALKQARYEYLANQPTLSWGNLLNGRTLPVIGVISTHFAFASHKKNIVNALTGKESFRGLDHWYGKAGDKAYSLLRNGKYTGSMLEAGERHLDKGIEKYIASTSPEDLRIYKKTDGSRINGQDRMKGFVGNTVVDLCYSGGVAIATFIASHLFAFRHAEKNETRNAANEGRTPVKAHFQLDTSPTLPTLPPQEDSPSLRIESAEHQNRLQPSHALANSI